MNQDDRIQCQQGYQPDDNGNCIRCKSPRCGAFEHKPNLCVVYRVCLKCMDQGVDKDSFCQTCGKNELVFAGPNTTEHFSQWLFSGENQRGHGYCTQFQKLRFIAHTRVSVPKRCETNYNSQWCQEHAYRSTRMSC